MLTIEDFGRKTFSGGKTVYAVAGPLLGMISSSYNLGAILAVPIVPVINPSLCLIFLYF